MAKPRMARMATLALLAAVVAAAGGCGSNLAQVSGVVSVDGTPLGSSDDVRVTVTFQPAGGEGRVAVGLADAAGQYHLSSGSETGVAPGEYLVTCSATQLVRNKEGFPAGGRRLTDSKYASPKTSGLTFTVQPGSNEFNLALSPPARAAAHRP